MTNPQLETAATPTGSLPASPLPGVLFPSLRKSIQHITELPDLSTCEKIRSLTGLFFRTPSAQLTMQDAARILLAIEILASKELVK